MSTNSAPPAAPMPRLTPFRLALVQLGQTGADKAFNLAHARRSVLKAKQEGKADVVVLPECFNSPYGVSYFPQYAEQVAWPMPATPSSDRVDREEAVAAKTDVPVEDDLAMRRERWRVEDCPSESIKMLSKVAKEAGVVLIGGSIPERDPTTDKLYNTCPIFDESGKLLAIHRKLHLFNIDIPGKITFKESETLTGGNALTEVDTKYGKIGIGICYDIRFPEMAQIAARRGCAAMFYPSAFNLTTGPLHWELLQRARAVDNQIYVAMCSPARDMNASYHAWGHSMVVDPQGTVIATTDEKESIVYADIATEPLQAARTGIPVTTQRRFDVYKDVSASA